MKSRPFLEDLLFCLEKFGASSPLHRILLFSNSIEVLLFFYFPPPPFLGYTKGLESFFPDFHPTLVLELAMFLLYDANEDPFVPIFVGAVAFLNEFLYLHTMQKLANFNCCQNISDKNSLKIGKIPKITVLKMN